VAKEEKEMEMLPGPFMTQEQSMPLL